MKPVYFLFGLPAVWLLLAAPMPLELEREAFNFSKREHTAAVQTIPVVVHIFQDNGPESINRWNPKDYLNIWVAEWEYFNGKVGSASSAFNPQTRCAPNHGKAKSFSETST